MTEFDQLQEIGLRESEAQFGDTITIDGREYPGCCSDAESSFDLMEGGAPESLTAYFILRKSVYPQRPAERKTVLVNGARRMMKTVNNDRVSWKIGIEVER